MTAIARGRSGELIYCDHQENRKSVIGRVHFKLRVVPSGVPLPASGQSALAASGLSLESTQRGTTTSQPAECSDSDSEWTVTREYPATRGTTTSQRAECSEWTVYQLADGLKSRELYRRARPGSCGATAHFPNPKSRYSEPHWQATRKERKFRETS